MENPLLKFNGDRSVYQRWPSFAAPGVFGHSRCGGQRTKKEGILYLTTPRRIAGKGDMQTALRK